MISNDASALKSLAVSGSPKICASGHHLLIILKAGKAAEDRCSSQKKGRRKEQKRRNCLRYYAFSPIIMETV